MIIGVPTEIKNGENRVAITPAGTRELAKSGHHILIQEGAGVGTGFTDKDYHEAGATLIPSIEEVYNQAEMILKVKEPVGIEYNLIKPDQIVFTYFHFASNKQLTQAMMATEAVCIAYETVTLPDNSLPLLLPMSEVAGRMSIQQGAKYLEKTYEGRGILLGGVPGVRPAKVLIIGGGIVGTQAAKMAAGLGADVTIMETDLARMRFLADIMPANVNTLMSNEYNIKSLLDSHDLIIGGVLIPGSKAPKLITKDMLQFMKAGTTLVDVAIDQGGCFETSYPTTHEDPIYIVDDMVHYCVTNMPGAVPYTSTLALTNATLPYAKKLADNGWQNACRENAPLRSGLNIIHGKIVFKPVADAFGFESTAVDAFF